MVNNGAGRLAIDANSDWSMFEMLDLHTSDVLVLVSRAALLLSFNWLLYKTWRILQPRDDHSLRSVAILVLGDIGRSPRMMYHAQSFAELGFMTDLIGYGGVC